MMEGQQGVGGSDWASQQRIKADETGKQALSSIAHPVHPLENPLLTDLLRQAASAIDGGGYCRS
ncbi:hypothetical protein K9N68_25585 [Kovacikia minuta CCNUW1]|uniref:hypothetical protein n=1 Tax=Kovacikia minuta TaxID=2931930 RepID=UPI001CC98F6B|nr:hypothetical protein [Kovacikia minuta]UBF24984.1 hypothetical protein K9N68_25585 [Kovacikia minuta CCNUW1]